MGLILQSTPQMGEYSAEVRRESFYMRGQDACAAFHEGDEYPRHGIHVYPAMAREVDSKMVARQGTVEILTEDIPKIRALLDAVEAEAHGSVTSASEHLERLIDQQQATIERLQQALDDVAATSLAGS